MEEEAVQLELPLTQEEEQAEAIRIWTDPVKTKYSRIDLFRREQLAWAAGFYEGEGSVTLYKNNKSMRGHLSIANTDKSTLYKFYCAVLCIGAVRGPYFYTHPSAKSPWKPKYTYKCTSFEHIQAVCCMLWPWLSERRKQQFIKVLLGNTELGQICRTRKVCCKEGCNNKLYGLNLCKNHYMQQWKQKKKQLS